MQRMKFARIGGFSSVKYKPGLMSDYHTPPKRKGIFAFIWPHIDLFFVYWHDQGIREHKHHGVRIFSYDGPIWTHLCGYGCLECQEDCTKREWVGAWHCVTVPELEKIYQITLHQDMRQITETFMLGGGWKPKTKEEFEKRRREVLARRGFPVIRNPYKRGLTTAWTISRDHLEVFIEGKHLNKIK